MELKDLAHFIIKNNYDFKSIKEAIHAYKNNVNRNIKYELTNITNEYRGHRVYRIKALMSFSDVKKGDLGGFIANPSNLSQEGPCWVYDNAIVCDNAIVKNNAQIRNNAVICDKAIIGENALIQNYVVIEHYSTIYGNAIVRHQAKIKHFANVKGNAIIEKTAVVGGNSSVRDDSIITGDANIKDDMIIAKDSVISNMNDVLYIRNNWSSGRGITYTRSNKLYHTGCFSGTAKELIEKAEKDSIFQNIYQDKPIKFKEVINFVNKIYNNE